MTVLYNCWQYYQIVAQVFLLKLLPKINAFKKFYILLFNIYYLDIHYVYSPAFMLFQLSLLVKLSHSVSREQIMSVFFCKKKNVVNTSKYWTMCASIGLFQPILGLQAVSGFRDLRVVNYKVIVFLVLLLLSHYDTEVNPGPKRKLSKLSCCHWNVNNILVHNKLSLIIAYNTVQKFDIICTSETYINL